MTCPSLHGQEVIGLQHKWCFDLRTYVYNDGEDDNMTI